MTMGFVRHMRGTDVLLAGEVQQLEIVVQPAGCGGHFVGTPEQAYLPGWT